MAKYEAANMNLSKSMFELSNQLYYSAITFLLENVIGLSQERAVSLRGLKGCEPGVDTNLFLESTYKCYLFHFLILPFYLYNGVRVEVRKQEIGIINDEIK